MIKKVRTLRTLWPLLVFTLVVIVLFGRLFTPNYVYMQKNGQMYYHLLVNKHYESERLRSGEFPLWSSAEGMGMPVLPKVTTRMFDPTTYLFIPFSFQVGFNAKILLTLFLLGGLISIYGYYLRLEPLAIMATMLCWVYDHNAIWSLQIDDRLASLSLIPMCFLLIDEIADKKRYGRIIPLTLLIALAYFWGNFHIGLIIMGFVISYYLYRVGIRSGYVINLAGQVAIIILLFLGLTAVKWIGNMELFHEAYSQGGEEAIVIAAKHPIRIIDFVLPMGTLTGMQYDSQYLADQYRFYLLNHKEDK